MHGTLRIHSSKHFYWSQRTSIIARVCGLSGLWAVLNNAGVGAGGPIEWLTVDDYKMVSATIV